MNDSIATPPLEKSGSNKGRWILILLAVLLVLIIAAAATIFMTSRGQEKAHFELGQEALETGQYEDAVLEFNRAIAVRPDFLRQLTAESVTKRGLAHLGLENYQAVIDDLNVTLTQDPAQPELLLARATALKEIGDFAAAKRDVTAVMDGEGESAELLTMRAALSINQGDMPAAIEDYTLALEYDSSLIEPRLVRLRHAVVGNQPEQILAEADELIKQGAEVAEPHIARGSVMLHNRLDQAARADFEAAVGIEPDNLEALSLLAFTEFLNGKHEKARTEAESALAIADQDPLALAVLAAEKIMAGDDTALADLNWAVANAPDGLPLGQTLTIRALVHLQNNQLEGAQSDVEKIIEVAPEWSWGHVLMGDIHLQKNEQPQAVTAFKMATQLDPNSAVAYAGRARGYLAQDDHQAALVDLEHALSLNPDYLPALLGHAEASIAGAEYDQALSDLNRALILSPDDSDLYARRGAVNLTLEKWQETITDYDKVLMERPEDQGALIGRAIAAEELGDYESVLADLTAAIAVGPENREVRLRRARAFISLEQYDAAFNDTQILLAQNDQEEEAYYFAGRIQLENENYFDAVVSLTKALDLNDELALAYAARSRAHYELEDHDRARSDASQALELAPDLVEGYTVRALAALASGDWAEALEDADRAIDLAPLDGSVYETRGLVHLVSGEASRAVDDFDQMLAMEPDSTDARLYRAAALDELSRYQEAITELQLALDAARDVTDVEHAESIIADLRRIPPDEDGYRRWTDAYHGFSITYPVGWRQYVDPGEPFPMLIVGPLDQDYRATVVVDVFELDFVPVARDIARYYGPSISDFSDFELVDESATRVAGKPAHLREFAWSTIDERLSDVQVGVHQVYIVDGQRILILTTMFLAEDREKYGPFFQDMLDSLALD